MVHVFTALGCYIAVDVNSGAVHELDEITYETLRLIKPPMEESCPEEIKKLLSRFDGNDVDVAWRELYSLFLQGMLFSEDEYIDAAAAVPKHAPVKALCLHVSHDCNLRCRYCFASTGDFGTGRRIMDFDVAKKAIDFVVERSGKRKNIEIDFFGGEPLMAMDVVRKTVEYAKDIEKSNNKKFRFTITTNGLLLNDENIEYINREMKNVVLSLDGTKDVNDRMRPTADGRGSYDIVAPRLKKLVDRRGDGEYYVRGTFTKENTEFTKDVLHLADIGLGTFRSNLW
jgi:uncharacterized protein